jgi:hypothetical protein
MFIYLWVVLLNNKIHHPQVTTILIYVDVLGFNHQSIWNSCFANIISNEPTLIYEFQWIWLMIYWLVFNVNKDIHKKS